MEKRQNLINLGRCRANVVQLGIFYGMKKAQSSDFQNNCACAFEVGSRFELLYAVLQTAA